MSTCEVYSAPVWVESTTGGPPAMQSRSLLRKRVSSKYAPWSRAPAGKMSPSRPVTAKRLPRLSTSLSVPVDSGSEPRSSYPRSSRAGAVIRAREGRTSRLRGGVRLVFLRHELVHLGRAVQPEVFVRHPRRGPPLQRL